MRRLYQNKYTRQACSAAVDGAERLRHGITGVQPPLPRKADEDAEFVSEFVARDHVALAIAHLGMTEREAWAMTMTSLVGALRTKFPQAKSNAPGAKAPTEEEHSATMDWFEKIEAEALHLPKKERAALIQKLALSLDSPSPEELREASLYEAFAPSVPTPCGIASSSSTRLNMVVG